MPDRTIAVREDMVMSNKNPKVISIKKDIKFNVATIMIAVILVYVIICIFISANKNPITTYKVNKSSVNNNITLEGIAVRDEQILNATKSGYICYYIRDGEKIKNQSTVCTIDETGQIYNTIDDTENYENLLTADDLNDIRSLISLYKVGYRDVSFYSAYNFETNVNNRVLELSNEILMQQANQGSGSAMLTAITAPESGIVTYYTDGFETFNIANVTMADFDKSKYSKETLKTGDIISEGKPIIKIIPDEEWNIVAPISAEQASLLSEKTKIRFKINNSSYDVIMPFEIIHGSDGIYINIMLDKYMSNFISERYVDVEILTDEETGLKIPVSSIVEKDVYKIPVQYFTAGGNQSASNRINLQSKSEKGELTITQITPTIYYSDEEYCLVDPMLFENSDVIININTNETLAVSMLETEKIKGVYSANRGTAEFKEITILKTIDEFALIESNEKIKVYDNIILDSSQVKENQIIY